MQIFITHWPGGGAGSVGSTLSGHGNSPIKTGKLLSSAWAKAIATAAAAKKKRQTEEVVIAPRALFCLTLNNPIRRAAISLIRWK